MAENQRPENASFVDRLTGGGKAAPETRLLRGWFGDSGKEGTRRLYLDPELSSYVDIPEDAVLNSEAVPDSQPGGCVLVWVRADAALASSSASRASSFLKGQLLQDLLGEGAEQRGGFRCATQVPCGEPTGFTGACTKQPVVGGAWPCITAIPHCAEPTGFTGKCTHVPWPLPTVYYGCTMLHCPTHDLTCIPAICNAVASGLPGCGGGNPVEQGPQEQTAEKAQIPKTDLIGCGYTKTWGLCETHLIGCTGFLGCQPSVQQPCITQTEIGPQCIAQNAAGGGAGGGGAQQAVGGPNIAINTQFVSCRSDFVICNFTHQPQCWTTRFEPHCWITRPIICYAQQQQGCYPVTEQPNLTPRTTPIIQPVANFAQQQVGGPQPSAICATAIACNLTQFCGPTHFFCPPHTLLCRTVIECTAVCPIPTPPWTVTPTTPVFQQQPFAQQPVFQQAAFGQAAGPDTLSPEICTSVNCTFIGCPSIGIACTILPPDCPPQTQDPQQCTTVGCTQMGCPTYDPTCPSNGPLCQTTLCQGGGGGGGAQQFGGPATQIGCLTPIPQLCAHTRQFQCPTRVPWQCPTHNPLNCASRPPICPPGSTVCPTRLNELCQPTLPAQCPSPLVVCQASPVPFCAGPSPIGCGPEVTQACGTPVQRGGEQMAAVGAPGGGARTWPPYLCHNTLATVCTQIGCHQTLATVCTQIGCHPTQQSWCHQQTPVPQCLIHTAGCPSAVDACPTWGPCDPFTIYQQGYPPDYRQQAVPAGPQAAFAHAAVGAPMPTMFACTLGQPGCYTMQCTIPPQCHIPTTLPICQAQAGHAVLTQRFICPPTFTASLHCPSRFPLHCPIP